MDAHSKLLLKRHLLTAARAYKYLARELPAKAAKYEALAAEAMEMAERLA